VSQKASPEAHPRSGPSSLQRSSRPSRTGRLVDIPVRPGIRQSPPPTGLVCIGQRRGFTPRCGRARLAGPSWLASACHILEETHSPAKRDQPIASAFCCLIWSTENSRNFAQMITQPALRALRGRTRILLGRNAQLRVRADCETGATTSKRQQGQCPTWFGKARGAGPASKTRAHASSAPGRSIQPREPASIHDVLAVINTVTNQRCPCRTVTNDTATQSTRQTARADEQPKGRRRGRLLFFLPATLFQAVGFKLGDPLAFVCRWPARRRVFRVGEWPVVPAWE